MATTFDNSTHTNSTISIASGTDLVFGSGAFWTLTSAGSIVTLAGNSRFRCAGQVYADGTGVTGTGLGNAVEVTTTGVIGGGSGSAITLGDFSGVVNAGFLSGVNAIVFSGTGNTVTNTGTIIGETNTIDFGSGASANRMTNSGTIVSTSDDAIQFSGTGNATVVNSGLIVAEKSTGILQLGSGAVTIDNSGTISAIGAIATGSAADRVINSGTLNGTVILNAGDDLYDGTSGTVSGRVSGGTGDDTLIGGAAGDFLDGSSNDDLLIGNGGNDILTGGGGGDELDGGNGRDTADYGDQFAAVTADLVNSDLNLGAADGDLYIAIENLAGGFDDDRLFGDSLRNVLRGGAGAGNDFLDGRGGGDRMVGGGGDDTYVVDNARDRTVELDSSGIDTVRATVSYTCQESIENLVLLGSAAINGTGNTQANVITGNAGANVLNGGFANDSLTGGGGADTFRLDSALDPDNNVDTINDFLVGTDKISLSRAIFTELNGGGALQATRFVIGGAALDASDRIIYNATTGVLSYDADGNGAGAQIAFAQIGTGLALTVADFILTG